MSPDLLLDIRSTMTGHGNHMGASCDSLILDVPGAE
jgi:hypothetical protein